MPLNRTRARPLAGRAPTPAAAVMGAGPVALSPLAGRQHRRRSATPSRSGQRSRPRSRARRQAVIAFANADFEQCEGRWPPSPAPADGARPPGNLAGAVRPLPRHRPTCTSSNLALADYAQRFGWSAPQWFSCPSCRSAAAEPPPRSAPNQRRPRRAGRWICPEHVDADAWRRLRSQSLQMPLPWVLDWGSCGHMDPRGLAAAVGRCSQLDPPELDMRWLNGERWSLSTDASPTPTGVRDRRPAYWLLRLDALRMLGRRPVRRVAIGSW